MTKKPLHHAEHLEIHYTKQHWKQLAKLRSQATSLMTTLEKANIDTVTHGSIARGDVSANSDIDIYIPNPPSSFTIETTLERAKIPTTNRQITQATPNYAIKAYIQINSQQTISFPLTKMRTTERDFYRFSGEAALTTLKQNKRVPGVDKRLMLIQPTPKGHTETTIIGREEETAKLLKISHETILDRIHALLRRNKIGRTGVFIKKELTPNETFEMALKKLAETKPEVRKRLKLSL